MNPPTRAALVIAAALSLLAASLAAAQPSSAAAPGPTSSSGAAAAPLDAAARAAIVDSVARVLEARYAHEQIAPRLSARIRQRLAAGAYDRETEAPAFGAALMRDLQGVVADKHLRISYEPEREFSLAPAAGGAPRAGGTAPWTRIDARDSAQVARTNFAFERVERLPGNVGYLKLDQFVPLDWSRETVAAAMAFLANTDAVVVDLRDNVGGAPQTVEMILSYFFGPEPVSLITTYGRFANVTTERRTLREVPGRRMPDADLWVLTSRNSASAAETFAYAVKRTGRGTVVGETTAGAGNGGAKLSVGHGLALFVPQFRVVSGPGYEATGVAPHVAADADDAPALAHRMALERLAGRAADPLVRREREWALEMVRAAASPVLPAEADLRRYEGVYGARTIRVRDGGLVAVGTTGWVTRLTPLGDGVFRSDGARFRFQTDAAGAATALTVETLAGRTTTEPRAPS